MAQKQLMFDAQARLELKKGLDQLANAVKVTMGPTGRNVILDKSFGGPAVTKDGVPRRARDLIRTVPRH